MPKLKPNDKTKKCLKCGKQLIRKYFPNSNRYEDYGIYQKRKHCGFNCLKGTNRINLWKKDARAEHTGHQRARRIFIFKNICEICKKYKKRTDIHHIDKNSYNNEKNNLIEICRSCHSKLHKRNWQMAHATEIFEMYREDIND